MRRKPLGNYNPIYFVQAWNEEKDDWETIDKEDCRCFIGRTCFNGCALDKAKDLEALEGKGNVRVAHLFIGEPRKGHAYVLWPLGQVKQHDAAPWRAARRHAFDYNWFAPYTTSIL